MEIKKRCSKQRKIYDQEILKNRIQQLCCAKHACNRNVVEFQAIRQIIFLILIL